MLQVLSGSLNLRPGLGLHNNSWPVSRLSPSPGHYHSPKPFSSTATRPNPRHIATFSNSNAGPPKAVHKGLFKYESIPNPDYSPSLVTLGAMPPNPLYAPTDSRPNLNPSSSPKPRCFLTQINLYHHIAKTARLSHSSCINIIAITVLFTPDG